MLRILLAAGVWLAMCVSGTGQEKLESEPLRVVTTFLPAYCFAANAAGGFAHVENLLPASVSPHDYQYTPADLRRLTGADLVVMNGLGLDDWLIDAVRSNAGAKTPRIVRLADGLAEKRLRELTAAPGASSGASSGHAPNEGVNPHIWLDPVLAMHSVSNITAALQQEDPVHREEFARRGTEFQHTLAALDAEAQSLIDSFSRKQVVTYHDAFEYFARRYGLEVVGVVEEVPGVSSSPQHLSNLLRVMRQLGIQVIFTEPNVTPRLARQLSRDLGVALGELDTLETGPLSPGSYLEGMRRNLQTLEKHLR